ncbi:MAG: hypothetical protein AAFX87_15765 [Bacteroidota bacterium]
MKKVNFASIILISAILMSSTALIVEAEGQPHIFGAPRGTVVGFLAGASIITFAIGLSKWLKVHKENKTVQSDKDARVKLL